MNCAFCRRNEPIYQFLGGESCCKKCYIEMERKIEDFLDSDESKNIKEITNSLLNNWDIPLWLGSNAVKGIIQEGCKSRNIIEEFCPGSKIEYKLNLRG